MADEGKRYPLFGEEQARAVEQLRIAMRSGIQVPPPKDPGGGPTHEQHKRNYQAILAAGTLYRLTGERRYVDFARDLLLEYARIYPGLGPHPAARDSQIPGRLFWQMLNDSVWLAHAIQGYDAIRGALDAGTRRTIDDDVFRRMARFLSDETPANFDRIHNHATWAVAGVGMTGYVLRDPELVDKALMGLKQDGSAGFLKQIDALFSPDGYYAEGPYYQRYALMPFVVFANAIERNEPQRRIFERKAGVLLRAVDTLVHTSYGGHFFPINDAMPDKGLDTEELVAGIAIAYAQTDDDRLLSVAQRQGRTLLSPEGFGLAKAMANDQAKPFAFRPILLRDGPTGEDGALGILRTGNDRSGQALVMKATSQGMGHGHFDRLHWLFYDNGHAVVTDYGAARFLNVEAKVGGTYLPENTSWAKQTVAHNTLVVDERSQFGGDWKAGEKHVPTPLLFEAKNGAGSDAGRSVQIVSARMDAAYPGVGFVRTLALVSHPDLGLPVVVDLLRVDGDRAARYDLPLHYAGHVMTVGFDARRNVSSRPVLGKNDGYQHLWVDAESEASDDTRMLSWMTGRRFYTYRFGASAPTRALLVESGANDPDFNLRREPALIRRMDGQRDASFFAVLEPHGAYDGTAETVRDARSAIRDVRRVRGEDAEAVVVELVSGAVVALAVADDSASERQHRIVIDGEVHEWVGGYARFDFDRHSRESGNPATFERRRAKTLDPRLRGDDGKAIVRANVSTER